MNIKKKIGITSGVIIVLIFIAIFMVGCSDNDNSYNFSVGEKITLTEDAPVCSSEENVDKMINFVKNKNEDAIENMEKNNEAKVISKGEEVTIIKLGIVIEIEDSDGQDWYLPCEGLK